MGEECRCGRCGHAWNRNTDNPVRCPNCGTYRWDEEPTVNECCVCNHKWFSRTSKVPVRCPACKTRSWNTGKRQRMKKQVLDNRDNDMVMDLYGKGKGCIAISLETGMSLALVYDIVKGNLDITDNPRM